MPRTADARYRILKWEEHPWDEAEGAPKLTRARVEKAFSGDFEGTSVLEYLMLYRDDGTAAFVGFERLTGRLAGLEGSFVLEHVGTFAEGVAKGSQSVVRSTGTGDLRGLEGRSGFESAHAAEHPWTLTYEIE